MIVSEAYGSSLILSKVLEVPSLVIFKVIENSQWEHYLIGCEFIIYSDHYALKYLNNQKRISKLYKRGGPSFCKNFLSSLRIRREFQNKVIDTLSQCVDLIVTLRQQFVGFDEFKEMYAVDGEFSSIQEKCNKQQPMDDFHIHDGFVL